MKFRFRLERMLQFVELREATKRTEIATLRQAIHSGEQRKIGLEGSIRKMLVDSRARLAINASWVPYEVQKIDADSKEILKIERELVKHHETLLIKQEELSRLSMRKKALESLKDKRKLDFSLNQSRREQKLLDESYRTVKRK